MRAAICIASGEPEEHKAKGIHLTVVLLAPTLYERKPMLGFGGGSSRVQHLPCQPQPTFGRCQPIW